MITYTTQIEVSNQDWKTCNENAFLKKIEELPKYGNCVCEVIPDDTPVKLYFDIDIGGELREGVEIGDICYDVIDGEAVPLLRNHFKDVALDWGIMEASSLKYFKYGSTTPVWKCSVRIIINSILATKKQQLAIVRDLNRIIGTSWHYIIEDCGFETMPLFFDEGVYDSNRKMRTLGSSKRGENRPLRLWGDTTPEKTVITGFFPADAHILNFEVPTAVAVAAADYDGSGNIDFLTRCLDAGLFGRRSVEYETWSQMGWAIKNSYGDEGFPLFDRFSRLCPAKYNTNEVREFWEDINMERHKKLTEGSIRHWAKEENPAVYKQIEDEMANICIVPEAAPVAQAAPAPEAKPAAAEPAGDINDTTLSFDEKKAIFEKTHFKVISEALYFRECEDGEIITYNEAKLKSAYIHLLHTEPVYNKQGTVISTKTSRFISEWIKCDRIRKYDRVGIYPNMDAPQNVYNMWQPFRMEKITDYTPNEEGLQFILNHIKKLLNDDTAVYDYVIKWIAQMIQYPAHKSTHITLYGEEGTGKTSVVLLLRAMFGNKRVLETTNPLRDVWGQFNGMMQNAFVVNLNEISKKDTLQVEGQMKAAITDSTIAINKKGQDAYVIDSYHRYISTTNNAEHLRTHKNDRRNLMTQVSSVFVKNTEHFNKFYNYLNDDNVVKTCYEYFKTVPGVDNFNSIPIPHTEYQETLKLLSKTPIELWLLSFCSMDHKGKNEFTNEQLYKDFAYFISENNFKYECNSNQFAVRLQNMRLKDIENVRIGKVGTRGKKFDFYNLLLVLDRD